MYDITEYLAICNHVITSIEDIVDSSPDENMHRVYERLVGCERCRGRYICTGDTTSSSVANNSDIEQQNVELTERIRVLEREVDVLHQRLIILDRPLRRVTVPIPQ